ncbi:preprotein translocase subunit YajC [Thermocatellispora tengchongensis]|uniref:Preprotein translocase subunit YajC n=1 Tax=Thermocatellispora tengchongensis TaxID=1073253 RepID=A0A840PME5_9ACTN|nr:preprotein translocase subunit YajC [Thermocatellispora tengchongensis]MBB5140242.1 preprotein translocase subunit YajC [Thermocatellispora tengchongensis]
MGSNNALTSFLPLILLVVVFYFLLIRPQRKRQQEQLRMQNSLAPGARVMTTTGLFGDVVAVDGDDVILEIAPGVETRWVKAAIGRVVTDAEAPAADGEGEKDDTVAGTAEPADTVDGEQKDSSTKKS